MGDIDAHLYGTMSHLVYFLNESKAVPFIWQENGCPSSVCTAAPWPKGMFSTFDLISIDQITSVENTKIRWRLDHFSMISHDKEVFVLNFRNNLMLEEKVNNQFEFLDQEHSMHELHMPDISRSRREDMRQLQKYTRVIPINKRKKDSKYFQKSFRSTSQRWMAMSPNNDLCIAEGILSLMAFSNGKILQFFNIDPLIYNNMASFKEFDYTHLLSDDPKLRLASEQSNLQAKQHPQEYYQFLTREITKTNDEFKASVAFAVLRMLVTEVEFSAEALLEMLEFYSNLFITSKKQSFINSFSLLLQALLVQVDRHTSNFNRTQSLSELRVRSFQCYLKKEEQLLNGQVNGLKLALLLSFLGMYLEHLLRKNISFTILNKCDFQLVYEKVNSITFYGNDQETQQFRKAKGNFFVLMLLNIRKFHSQIFFEYFSLIPKRVCQYISVMMTQKLISTEEIHSMLRFFLEYLIVNSSIVEKLLVLDLQTHLSINNCLNLFIHHTEEIRFNNSLKIQSDEPLPNSPTQLQNSRENEFQQAMKAEISSEVCIEDHFNNLFLWIFRTLLTHEHLEERNVFKLSRPLITLFKKEVESDDKIDIFVNWMMSCLEEGTKGEEIYENYCYFFYYMHGQFFHDYHIPKIKHKVANSALQDLKSQRFANHRDQCSILYYLRNYINSRLVQPNFYNQFIKVIKSQFHRFKNDEFSYALIACFTPLGRLSSTRSNQTVMDNLWPSISLCQPEQKENILRSLRERLHEEREINYLFVSDLLMMIHQSEEIFRFYYLYEKLYVRVEYLRLIALCAAKIPSINHSLSIILSFMQSLLEHQIQESLQIQEILSIFAALLHRENEKVKVEKILPKLQVVELLLSKSTDFSRQIRDHQSLLIEIASLPYSLQQDKQRKAVHKLQTSAIDFLLSDNLDDRLCDILQIFFTLNQAAISEKATEIILAKVKGSVNYYRFAYLLSPIPYPNCQIEDIKLTQLKHYKWASLFLIGKYHPPNFSNYARAARDQTSQLAQEIGAMGLELKSSEFYSFMMMVNELQKFNVDDDKSWLLGIQTSSVAGIFSELYLSRYQISSIKQELRNILKQFGYELH